MGGECFIPGPPGSTSGNLENIEAHRIYDAYAKNSNPIVDIPEINVEACILNENTRGYIAAGFPTVFQNGSGDSYSGYYFQPDYDERTVYILRRACCHAQSHMRLR